MKQLNDAILSLKQELKEKGYRDGIVQEIASEWEVHPELLHRKFCEATSTIPERYLIINMSSTLHERAKTAAMEWWSNEYFIDELDSDRPFIAGKTFQFEHEEYIGVTQIDRTICCVRVTTAEHYYIKFPSRQVAVSWILNATSQKE